MYTTIAIYSQRVLYIKAIERNCTVANRRHERMLKDADLIVIDIDISKDILSDSIQYLASLEEVINTR